MARRSTAVAWLWCLALIASVSSATGAADVPAAGASRDDGPDVGSIDAVDAIGDATRAGPVAVVFVTSRDAESLSPCRAGLLRALRASAADLPDHDVFVLHGGDATGPMARGDRPDDDDDVETPPATMLSQNALRPLVPERLRCDCSSGNGATPFAFMAWLASNRSLESLESSETASDDDARAAAPNRSTRLVSEKRYAFAWYVEEDVVFTGNWREVFRLRTVSTPESRVREVEVFGALSGASLPPMNRLAPEEDFKKNASRPTADASASSFATSPVDLVAHVERVAGNWKKRCRMPGDGSASQSNGTGCASSYGGKKNARGESEKKNGSDTEDASFMYSAWWPVMGASRAFAARLVASLADPDGANGHQEPLTMSFCLRMNREEASKSTKATFSAREDDDRRDRADRRRAPGPSADDGDERLEGADAQRNPACAFRLAPSALLGEYQLGHWGRFVGRPKSHPTFTAPGLTYGHNLRFERLYHPLKCEADAGIGALAAACANGRLAGDEKSVTEKAKPTTPRRALAADGGGGGGGGGGVETVETARISAESSLRALRDTYFEKKPWALAFDDGGYGGRRPESGNASPFQQSGFSVGALEGDPAAYAAAMAAAEERNEATASRARAAARPYARPVRGPKEKKSGR